MKTKANADNACAHRLEHCLHKIYLKHVLFSLEGTQELETSLTSSVLGVYFLL